MTNGLDWIFSLGNRVTRGDPRRLLDWNFWLMVIMFIAFFTIFLDNLYQFFFLTQRFTNLGWAFVMVAILWFQYQGLVQIYESRKMFKNLKPEKVESEKDMLEEFKDEDEQKAKETIN